MTFEYLVGFIEFIIHINGFRLIKKFMKILQNYCYYCFIELVIMLESRLKLGFKPRLELELQLQLEPELD